MENVGRLKKVKNVAVCPERTDFHNRRRAVALPADSA